MGMVIEAKRIKAGQSLTAMQNQAISAISQLQALKTNLQNLKVEIFNDTDFGADDENEIQAVLVNLASRLGEL